MSHFSEHNLFMVFIISFNQQIIHKRLKLLRTKDIWRERK